MRQGSFGALVSGQLQMVTSRGNRRNPENINSAALIHASITLHIISYKSMT
jgi:hypothetical protein